MLYNAIFAIGEIAIANPKNKEISKAVPRVIKFLEHEKKMLREISIWALEKSGNIEALPKLHVVWLNDPDTEIRKKAGNAINTIVEANKTQ